jgi:hypothetical protein
MRKLAKTRRLDWHSRRHLEPTTKWVGMRPARRSTETQLNLVVVADGETGRPESCWSRRRVWQLWNASDRTGTACLVLIDKE